MSWAIKKSKQSQKVGTRKLQIYIYLPRYLSLIIYKGPSINLQSKKNIRLNYLHPNMLDTSAIEVGIATDETEKRIKTTRTVSNISIYYF